MIDPKDLKWGQTPFDDMTRDEMHLLLRRMFMALVHGRSVVAMLKYGQETSPYWGDHGSGGKALAMMADVLAELKQDEHDEETFRSYFRYAGQLLFPDLPRDYSWWINDEGEGELIGCKTMPTAESHPEFNGAWRAFTFDDLKPEAELTVDTS